MTQVRHEKRTRKISKGMLGGSNFEWAKAVVIFGQKNHNSYGALMFVLLDDNGDRKR